MKFRIIRRAGKYYPEIFLDWEEPSMQWRSVGFVGHESIASAEQACYKYKAMLEVVFCKDVCQEFELWRLSFV